jgi:hypothetical protein
MEMIHWPGLVEFGKCAFLRLYIVPVGAGILLVSSFSFSILLRFIRPSFRYHGPFFVASDEILCLIHGFFVPICIRYLITRAGTDALSIFFDYIFRDLYQSTSVYRCIALHQYLLHAFKPTHPTLYITTPVLQPLPRYQSIKTTTKCATKSSNATPSANASTSNTPSTPVPPTANAATPSKKRQF